MGARVKFDVQGANQSIAARFTRAGSAARAAAVRFTNETGTEHYEAIYQATPKVSGLTRELLRLEAQPAGLGYRTGWLAADYLERGFYPYIYVVLYGNQAGTVVGNDFLEPINREFARRYQAGLPRAMKAAVQAV